MCELQHSLTFTSLLCYCMSARCRLRIALLGGIVFLLCISHNYSFFVAFKPGRKVDCCKVSKNCCSTFISSNSHNTCFAFLFRSADISELDKGSKQKEAKQCSLLFGDVVTEQHKHQPTSINANNYAGLTCELHV